MSRMKLTDLKPDEIYENTNGEIAQLKAMDGKGKVFVKILKEKDGEYHRETKGLHKGKVVIYTDAFLFFWRRIKQEPTTA